MNIIQAATTGLTYNNDPQRHCVVSYLDVGNLVSLPKGTPIKEYNTIIKRINKGYDEDGKTGKLSESRGRCDPDSPGV